MLNKQNQEKQTQNGEQALETRLARRDFLRACGAAGIALSLPLSSAAESGAATDDAVVVSRPPLPVVDARFPCRIADGIWIVPDKRIPLVPNIGIVEGDKTVLVIDAGLTLESGRAVLRAARAIAGKRNLMLTVTHAHPEHAFGAQAFKGEAKIFCNKLQRDYLARDGEKLLAGFRPLLAPGAGELLDDIRITLADEVYEGDQSEIDLGNRKVRFQTWGIAHSPGDQIITIPDQQVTFAGDLIEERIFPIVPLFPPLIEAASINLKTWETALAEITAQAPRIIVPGHGNLGGTEISDSVRDYFKDLRRFVAVAKSGKSTAEIVARKLEPIVRGRHPTWERTEFIAPAIRYLVEQSGS